MVPFDEAVYSFLTDLKHHRDVAKRLYELTEQHPEMVLAYIDSLPKYWETKLDEDYVALLFRMKVKAQALLDSDSTG